MIEFSCAGCGAKFRVDDSKGGKRSKCPKCGGAIDIPLAAGGPGGELDPLSALAAGEASAEAVAARPPTQEPADGYGMSPEGAPPIAAAPPVAAAPQEQVNAFGYAPRRAPVQQAGGGLATGAVILGACSLIPGLGVLTGLAAIITGLIGMTGGRPRKGLAIAGVAMALVFNAGWGVAGYKVFKAAEVMASTVQCNTNLHTIGTACAMYQTGNPDNMPPSLEALGSYGARGPTLQCPFSKTGNNPYFYLPASKTAPHTAFIACDLKSYHGEHRNRSVLCLDASVRTMSETEFQAALQLPENQQFAAELSKVDH